MANPVDYDKVFTDWCDITVKVRLYNNGHSEDNLDAIIGEPGLPQWALDQLEDAVILYQP